ncbi:hypothetical protein GUJ93_ZPchr0012g20586 [Zizania palustris]|uniref:Uncharacterized protein n=1 Tax=Zizania palustris TaxID=103762 RepID=A0A8J5WSM1_ZIZPA|nr:hypothetical protein GUJ93_ZPchr0012g20586 [Zizania palustris]
MRQHRPPALKAAERRCVLEDFIRRKRGAVPCAVVFNSVAIQVQGLYRLICRFLNSSCLESSAHIFASKLEYLGI